MNPNRFANPSSNPYTFFNVTPKELLKITWIHPCAVCRPKQPINHPLPFGKSNCQCCGEVAGSNPITVGTNIKCIDFELSFEQALSRTTESEEIISCHG